MSAPTLFSRRGGGGRGRSDAAPAVGALGMTVFLASLGMLFAASIVAYAVIRARAEAWQPSGAAGLPGGLWLGTLLLVGCSVAQQRALNAVRRGQARGLLRNLDWSLGLALGFVACQAWNWIRFFQTGALYGGNLYGFTFYMLTGLHVLHVFGGLIALGWVSYRARTGAYSWAYHAGVRHTAVYWHFLLAVWIVLLAILLVG